MSDNDPIFRAVTHGDQAMSDGDVLGKLGSLLRDGAQVPKPVDLRARVRAAILADTDVLDEAYTDAGFTAGVEDEAIDAWYNGDRASAVAADPLLEKLGDLIREAAKPPRTSDLLPRVNAQVQRQKSSRRQAVVLDRVSRWRIWTAVVAAHAAAFIALAAIHVSVDRENAPASPEMVEAMLRNQPGYHRIVPSRMIPNDGMESIDEWALPQQWSDLSQEPGFLFALRADDERKAQSRQDFAALSGGLAVHAMETWLVRQLEADGKIKGLNEDSSNAAMVARSAVIYAFLGEGLSESFGEESRGQWLKAALGGLGTDLQRVGDDLDARTHCLALLTLVEGAALLKKPDLIQQAEDLLQHNGFRLTQGVEEGGLGGFGLLAVEIAALNGLSLPSGLRADMQRHVARPLPSKAADPARLGVAAYAHQINGAGYAPSTAQQLNALMLRLPNSAVDQRLDLMAWYFPTLALREARDRRWVAWNQALEVTIQRSLQYDSEGGAHIAGEHMRYGDQFGVAADLTATAFAMMSLQAPYRYLPMGF